MLSKLGMHNAIAHDEFGQMSYRCGRSSPKAERHDYSCQMYAFIPAALGLHHVCSAIMMLMTQKGWSSNLDAQQRAMKILAVVLQYANATKVHHSAPCSSR